MRTRTHTVGQFTPFDLLVVRNDVYQALREADVELDDARCIFLEADGTITVLEKKS